MDDAAWDMLAEAQAGLLTQRQLSELGVARALVRNHLRARRWAQRTEFVLSVTTGPLSAEQRIWAAVLHAGPAALVGGLTAAALHGLRGWDRADVTVLVDNDLSFDEMDGVEYFRTRRPLAPMRARTELPLCRMDPAILLFAGYEPSRRTAHGAVAAVVQQRLTTPGRLRHELALMRPLRRAGELRGLLADVEGGAQSLAEVDVRRACREFGIALPRGQRGRRDRAGRQRWTDCEWDLPGGGVLVLEVDGAFHDDVLQAADDKSRHRKLSTTDRLVVSCSAFELRYDPASVVEDLLALGVPRAS